MYFSITVKNRLSLSYNTPENNFVTVASRKSDICLLCQSLICAEAHVKSSYGIVFVTFPHVGPFFKFAFKCIRLHVPEGTSPGNLTALATDKNSMDSFLATAVEQLDEAPMTKYISLETNNFSLVVK